jgi:spore coat polysaccharide biosynthesis protein SpsF (cytidylyltransferase family)
MSVVAIIQARMSSSRLPGKVLLPLAKKPVLGHLIERLSYCRLIDKIVVATTSELSDDPISSFCTKNDINCYRGSLEDVLDRYYHAAHEYSADSILRITGDCPAIDPIIVDAVISGFLAGDYDCYGLSGDFPDGLDCTVYSNFAIKKAWKEASLKSEREHVGPYIENNPAIFKNGSLELFHGLGVHRWTLDESDDYKLLKIIFDELYRSDSPFLSYEILRFIKRNPKIINLNKRIIRNEGYIKSLKEDGSFHD